MSLVLHVSLFFAIENNAPLVKTAEEVKKEVSFHYKKKLNIDDEGSTLDPFHLESEWLSEPEGAKF